MGQYRGQIFFISSTSLEKCIIYALTAPPNIIHVFHILFYRNIPGKRSSRQVNVVCLYLELFHVGKQRLQLHISFYQMCCQTSGLDHNIKNISNHVIIFCLALKYVHK